MIAIRKTVSGVTQIDFDQYAGNFLVKNFSSNAILVSFDEITSTTENKCVKIPSNIAQIVIPDAPHTVANKLFIKGSGEVEVDVLWN